MPAWNAYIPEHRSASSEAKWQKQIVILLGVVIALLIVLGTALSYAKMRGMFEPAPSWGTPPPPWTLPPWLEGSLDLHRNGIYDLGFTIHEARGGGLVNRTS